MSRIAIVVLVAIAVAWIVAEIMELGSPLPRNGVALGAIAAVLAFMVIQASRRRR